MRPVRQRILWTVLACGFLLTRVAHAADALSLIEWNQACLDAIRIQNTPPPAAARVLAILHTSIFDAVNSIAPTHQNYLIDISPNETLDEAGVAAGAAHRILSHFYPTETPTFDELIATQGNTPVSPNWNASVNWGIIYADFHLISRSTDRSQTQITYVPSDAPGDWRRTPPNYWPPDLPHWGQVEPFGVTNLVDLLPGGPPALSSWEYAFDLELTKLFGGRDSSFRSIYDTQSAYFWSDFNFTVTPPGHWNEIAQNIVARRALTLRQAVRLFALLNITLADTGIAVWDTKYRHNFWRPITAIRQADRDGSPETDPVQDWLPLLNTPPFPEYVSGHSAFSGSAAEILALFLGTHSVECSAWSDTLPGVRRDYTNLWHIAEEIGMSRIFGGIHFLSADIDGLHLGRDIARKVWQNCLLPLRSSAIESNTVIRISDKNLLTLSSQSTAGKATILVSDDLKIWNRHPAVPTNGAWNVTSLVQGKRSQFFRIVFE